jgi:hypothetical protein
MVETIEKMQSRDAGRQATKARSRNNRKDTAMNSQVLGLRVASIIFGLMSLAQLLRLVIQPEVLVAGHQMPLWPSVLALVVLGGLSIWLWKLSRTGPR